MKLYLKYDVQTIFRKILEEQLNTLNIKYEISGLGEIYFDEPLGIDDLKQVSTLLEIYGIEIINDHKSQVVQRVKEAITEIVADSSILNDKKMSDYLSERINYSYTYLSSIFSEVTYSSIENFLIIKKIDRAKELLLTEFTLKEIAHQLGYSSVAHLSGQFKKTTGLTPTSFQKIVKIRNSK